MFSILRSVMKRLLPVVDVMVFPFVYPAGLLLRFVRHTGVERLPRCRRTLRQLGVFPIRRHYYEPLFDDREIRRSLRDVRRLPGIDWNVSEQLSLLDEFHFAGELHSTPVEPTSQHAFHMNNGSFESGDAEFWYSMIRLRKPARIVEVGSGFSTLIARMALEMNERETPGYQCQHVCIEPYEMPWLEQAGLTTVRRRVEDVGESLFRELQRNDVLFIDSSHVIRPQGDVVFEYLELLPSLNCGVIVHVHDIFSPRDYPDEWVRSEVRLWGEQYLVEAFLTSNRDWKILAALNLLQHSHYERLRDACPFLSPTREPGSLYIQKVA